MSNDFVSPFDADPLSGEPVPSGQVRDYLGDLVVWPSNGSLLREEEILAQDAKFEIRPDFAGHAFLYVDDEEVGRVSYVTVTGRKLELTVASDNERYKGKLTLA